MRIVTAGIAAVLGLVIASTTAFAQSLHSASSSSSMSVPRVVSIGGEFRPADGSRPSGSETVTFRVYSEEHGGVPLWHETQTVPVDQFGFYNLMLGATERDGVPVHVFASGDARWVGITCRATEKWRGLGRGSRACRMP